MEVYWFLLATTLLVSFSVVPLGVDLLRFLFPHWSLSRIVGKAAHIFLFGTVTGLIIIIIRYHYFVYLPLLLDHESPFSSIKGLFHVIFSSWLWLNVIGNYYHTVSMHPGTDTSFRSRRVKFEEAKLASYGINVEPSPAVRTNGTDVSLYEDESTPRPEIIPIKNHRIVHEKVKPRTGVDWKPARTRFCSVCRCAVFYWDHHCPFTGNCIGLRNYSNFFIGLCYGVVGALYAIAITLPFFYSCNILPYFGEYHKFEEFEEVSTCTELGANSYIFLPVLLGFWLTFCSLLLNVILLLADLSTYDVLKNWDRYPMVKFMLQRMCAKKFLDSDSRLQVLIANRRDGLLWYLVPVRNSSLCV